MSLAAGGKPSTWFPPGGLVEQILASQPRGLLQVMFSIHLNLSGTYVTSYVLDTFEFMRNICFFWSQIRIKSHKKQVVSITEAIDRLGTIPDRSAMF